MKSKWMGRPIVRIARDPAMTSFAIAVLLTLSANVLFPLRDALTKQMITTLPVRAVLFVRRAAVLVVTLAIGRARLVQHVLVTPCKGFLAIRAAVMLCGWMAFNLWSEASVLGRQSPSTSFRRFWWRWRPSLLSVSAHHCRNGQRSCLASWRSRLQVGSRNSDFRQRSLSRCFLRAAGQSRS